jgi:hypothetical protein
MTGQIEWAVWGGIAVAAGIGLFLRANRAAKEELIKRKVRGADEI